MVTKESADDNEYERQRLLNIEKNKKLLKFVPHIHPTDRKGTLVSQASISVGGVIGETVGIDAREEEWYIKGLVEDFNWLRREHSPNWSLSEGKFSKDTWSMVLRKVGISDVNSILDLVISR